MRSPTINDVDDLITEEDELEFIKAFRDLMRIKNILTAFSDFNWEDLQMSEQQFEDFKSKYLDLYDKVKNDNKKEKVSILEDVDFELELIHRDEINVTYIISLLVKLKAQKQKDTSKAEAEIFNLLGTETTLRSKRELIERFIQENLPVIENADDIEPAFNKFWDEEEQKAFLKMVDEEHLSAERTEKLIENYLFAEREPMRDDILDLIEGEKPSLMQRKTLGERILQRIVEFVDTFKNGMNG